MAVPMDQIATTSSIIGGTSIYPRTSFTIPTGTNHHPHLFSNKDIEKDMVWETLSTSNKKIKGKYTIQIYLSCSIHSSG